MGVGGGGALQPLCSVRFCGTLVLCCAGCDLGPRWGSDVGVWGRVLQSFAEPVLPLPRPLAPPPQGQEMGTVQVSHCLPFYDLQQK